MFKSYWNIHPAFGIIICICVGVIFFVGWEYSSLKSAQSISERYFADSKAYKDDDWIIEHCSSVSGNHQKVKCALQEVESRKEWNQNSRDLEAQEGMEFWARWMFVASFLGVGVAIFSLELIRRTLNATWEAAKYTKVASEAAVETAIEAKKATVAASGSNEIAIRAVMDQQRPIIYIEPGEYNAEDWHWDEHTALKWDVVLKNYGSGPAKVIKAGYKIRMLSPFDRMPENMKINLIWAATNISVIPSGGTGKFTLPPSLGHSEKPLVLSVLA
jgi:hypothetical protein